MKSAALPVLLLTISLNSSYAADTEAGNDDIRSYCEQQAEMAGIENADEMKLYLKDCVDSFAVPSTEYQQAGE